MSKNKNREAYAEKKITERQSGLTKDRVKMMDNLASMGKKGYLEKFEYESGDPHIEKRGLEGIINGHLLHIYDINPDKEEAKGSIDGQPMPWDQAFKIWMKYCNSTEIYRESLDSAEGQVKESGKMQKAVNEVLE